ncbi:hypothetical protein ACFOKI_12075 [Sphingomonas qilianensis]|uniref:Uncharacterized protein n=1 Tax=Sphingomonas qilianensis TaxID=1736690 RepID=A0ABU9XNX3_9SPHN
MNRFSTALSGAFFIVSATSGAALAQSSTPAASPATVAAFQPAKGETVLRVGTAVPLRTTEELTTKGKKLKVGQRFNLEVSENVVINGTTVIPAGSPAVGEIMEVRNKGMWGKSGHFGARVLYLTANGRQIRLTGAFDDKGTAGGIGATAVSALVFLPAGFFMTGTSAMVAAGSPVKGFIDEDVQFAAVAAPSQPMVVAAPVAQVPVAPTK